MKLLIETIIQIIVGWAIIIFIMILIKNLIKFIINFFNKLQLKEQIRTQKLQQYYKQKDLAKQDYTITNIELKKENTPYKLNNNIFTEAERFFYKVLKDITIKMDLNILTKVRLADIIYTNEYNYKYFNKIKAKHIDFVLIDKDGNIKLLIELDDKSHENAQRKERDDFLNEIFKDKKIKLLRIPVKYSYNIEELENKIKESL